MSFSRGFRREICSRRHCEPSWAKQSSFGAASEAGWLRRKGLLAMTGLLLAAKIFKPNRRVAPLAIFKTAVRISRRATPESLKVFPPLGLVRPRRGRAGCRVPDAPAALCAKKGSTSAHKSSQRRHRKTRQSRTQWCYCLYRALLGEVLIAPVVPRIKVLSAPGWADEPPQDLTPASGAGPHGFAVRFDIVRPARPSSAHRLNLMAARPANSDHARYRRVHRISSRVRDDRDTPLVWDETNEHIGCFEQKGNKNIFRSGAGQPRNSGVSHKTVPSVPSVPPTSTMVCQRFLQSVSR